MNKVIYREIGKDPLYKTWHAADEHMIIYMYSDGGSIVCSEKIYPIKKGALCFIGAGTYHYTMPDVPETYERSKLFLAPEPFKKILNLFPFNGKFNESLIYAQIDALHMEDLENLFKELKENGKKNSELLAVSCCIKLLYYLDQYSLERSIAASGPIEKSIEYINNNIFYDIGIEDICAASHMSKYHFCRLFKQKTGSTVMNYILKTRIILAKNMLLKDRLSVSEISSRCGFSSPSYFCRVFKESTGKTPLEYRKLHA